VNTPTNDAYADIKAGIDLRHLAEQELQNTRWERETVKALCPWHDDHNPSLTVKREKYRCWSCGARGDVVDLLMQTRSLDKRQALEEAARLAGVTLPTTGHKPTPAGDGLTIQRYAEAKGLDVDELRGYGVSERQYWSKPALRISYRDREGTEQAVRYRLALEGDTRFVWKSGAKTRLYGLWRLPADPPESIVLCEGESDCHTLWHHGILALGLPGAGNWRDERDLPAFEGIETVFVVAEPDSGGESVKDWLARSELRHRARLVTL
jgi:CHC2 zinc finger